MPPKRKGASDKTSGPVSHAATGDSLPTSKRQRAEALFDTNSPEDSQPRRSSRTGRGNGGQLQQLQHLERIQVAKASRSSKRGLDTATQGLGVNPMAPSYEGAEEDEESQIPPWVSSTPATHPRPSFTLAQAGEQFGFRLPTQNADDSDNGVSRFRNRPSSVALTSAPSSRSASVFSAPLSRGGSTIPTSRVSSECANTDYGYDDLYVSTQHSLQLHADRVLQTRTSRHPSEEPVRTILDPLQSTSSVRGVEEPAKVDRPLSLRGSQLHRTHSFVKVPSTVSGTHTMFAMEDPDPDEENRVIDEASPSDDERIAEAALYGVDHAEHRGLDQASTDPEQLNHPDNIDSRRGQVSRVTSRPSEVEDVIAQHRQRNRAPRLPSNAQLLAIRDEQSTQRSCSDELDAPISASLQTPAINGHAEHSDSYSSHVATKRENPSQLQFYPPAVRDIIERAKQISHSELGSINSFPLRPQFNTKATAYVNEAIAERRKAGLLIPNGWWPQRAPDITKLLWEDVGNWRSALKKRARFFTRERYQWDPQNRPSVNAGIAKGLLEGGAFLKDGLDEDGRTNNLAHPALSAVIIDFFYTGSHSVGQLFPEVYSAEVPRPTVALAATAVKVALDKIVMEGKDVSFKRDVYADVYIDLLGLMSKCDTSPIHRAKTKALRVQWAKIGQNGNETRTMTGFDVDLD